MMPIFFHLQSHLWIAYLFFFNGLLLSHLISASSKSYRDLTYPIEAQVLAAFFMSISLNGLLLLSLNMLSWEFALMRFILPAVSVVLLGACVWQHIRAIVCTTYFSADHNIWRLALYAAVFVVLFYNGGLIEQTSDAWWHMSLANKIAIESSFVLDQGHLNGISDRYYPPLWHANLALAKTLSGQPLSVLWNSFTAWGAVIKVMAFYLFAFALSKNKLIAILSALLFVLLPGLGNAYLRVSAWPSHIAYTAWFSLFFVSFSLLDSIESKATGLSDRLRAIGSEVVKLLCALGLIIVIIFAHKLEVLFFALAILFYYSGLVIHSAYSKSQQRSVEPAEWLVNIVGKLIILSAIVAVITFAYQDLVWDKLTSDLAAAYLFPFLALLLLLYLQLRDSQLASLYRRDVAIGLLVLIGAVVLLSIDARHLLSLFDPELAYPKAKYQYLPLVTQGWFGSDLKLPGWHLQLRSGLLYSGVLAIPLSLLLAFLKPSRATIFLASTGIAASLFLISPYLFHWFREVTNYHSPWRIAILIFHPIVFAIAIQMAWQSWSVSKTN